jgi:hypothetical protein
MALRYKQKETRQRRADASAEVVRWVRILIGDENTGVSLSGNQCGHATCGGEETIILLMPPGGRTMGFKIATSLETVTQSDVAEALQPFLSPPRLIRVR